VLETSPNGTQRWELYRLLSEPVRLRLLALAADEELAIGELAELLGESQPNVSRHAAPLKQAGLVVVRKQGQRALVKLAAEAARDPVVADALASGRALCAADGSLARVAEVVRARDAVGRDFFAREESKDGGPDGGGPSELGAYLRALAPLLGRTRLAVDAGTGDGGLLEVLAPVFERVVAVDRSEVQLARARARAQARGWKNVELVRGELDGDAVARAVRGGDLDEGALADAVFAVRLLHHAPRPLDFVRQLGALCRPGGALVVLDYGRHDDESMRTRADVWLGFEPQELTALALEAGFDEPRITTIPEALHGRGPDAHLPWQAMVARKREGVSHPVPTAPESRALRRSKRGNDNG
jgi:ArsR family transcriptional regulator